ncbi:MAG: glycosyltransferase family 4 protein [Deltaproteobacteria bacterium]|nr:glycosyltransferase family 4 protein [Deltaproteobacteria bacterium]
MASILFLILGFHKPSSKKRILCSLDSLRSRGHTVDAIPIPLSFPGRMALLPVVRRADLVVLQKKLLNRCQLRFFCLTNPNLVFDLDDAVMFHEVERGEPVQGKYFQRFVRTVKSCRGVIAGNEYLAEFARAVFTGGREGSGRVTVLPTPVDTDLLRPKTFEKALDRVTLGWLGTKGNLVHLRLIERALSTVLTRNPEATFKVVSDANPVHFQCPHLFEPWNQTGENDMLKNFDIGLMPLEDNLWTRGKGGYKLLQYMAAGTASVASPVGINGEIIDHGKTGFLAETEEQWVEILTRLVRSPELRRKMGEAAREKVEAIYSLQAYNRRLATFLERFL